MSDRFELRRRYRFEAAHHLPKAPDGHRCRRLHGHGYEIEVTVAGEAGHSSGWVIDFADLDKVVEPVRAELDHQLLNDITGLENPTSEMLARWLWDRINSALPGLAAIRVSETPDSDCTYRG